jgi:hypothetical protein
MPSRRLGLVASDPPMLFSEPVASFSARFTLDHRDCSMITRLQMTQHCGNKRAEVTNFDLPSASGPRPRSSFAASMRTSCAVGGDLSSGARRYLFRRGKTASGTIAPISRLAGTGAATTLAADPSGAVHRTKKEQPHVAYNCRYPACLLAAGLRRFPHRGRAHPHSDRRRGHHGCVAFHPRPRPDAIVERLQRAR